MTAATPEEGPGSEPDVPVDAASAAIEGSLPDILAIIESAKARGGMESMERFVAKALPGAEEAEIREASRDWPSIDINTRVWKLPLA